ncbi:MAG: DUF4190 domain-containing protein [bacterium]|nr:DUF4190 domain-containing protein [bacterium]
MKNTLLFLSFLLLLSCSVQKRKYQKGFYVNRTHHQNHDQKTKSTKSDLAKLEEKKKPAVLHTGDRVQLAASDNTIEQLTQRKPLALKQSPPDTCDVLLFRDGSEIRAKVLEVAPTDIKYKRCDNIEGPSYVTRKSDLFMVKYANGTKEVMKEEAPAQKEFNTYNPSPQSQVKYNKKRAENHPLAALSLLLGILGIVIIIMGLFGSVANNSYTVSPIAIGASVISSFLAVVVGIVSMKQIGESDGALKGKGLALPGIIMGAVMLTIWLLILLATL